MVTEFRGQWSKEACQSCNQQFTCIGCSWLGRKAYRKFMLERMLHKQLPPTQAMIEGLRKHEEIEKNSGAKKYNVDSKYFWSKLKDTKKIIIAEPHICSRKLGLSGHPDQMTITIKKNPDRVFFDILELKGRWMKTYWLQPYGYAMIVADPLFLMGEYQFYLKLGLENAYVNVTATLQPYYNSQYQKTITILENNRFTHPQIKMAVLAQRRRYLDIISLKRVDETLPKCEPCNPDECSFYEYCKTHMPTKQLTLYQTCKVRCKRKKPILKHILITR
ncbi:hypothetical protein KEJ47_10510 [Candidatus Bathyarchaeota archaeon]|nr:hypothetical protein [Candidatus Bathyarchaeota archaeon]